MALYGSRYIQSIDPGAVGVGFEWLNDTTGDLSVRNMSNTGWVIVGNISKPYLGQINEGGGTMLGPLTGVTGWAPNTSPDFSTSAKLGGIDLATQQYVNDQISSLSIVINDRISEAIVTATSSVNVKSNFKVKIASGTSKYDTKPLTYTAPYQRTIATVVLPQYDNGVTANPEDCYAVCLQNNSAADLDLYADLTNAVQHGYTQDSGAWPGGVYYTSQDDLLRAAGADQGYLKVYAGTPTTSGVPVLADAWVKSSGTLLAIPTFYIRWTMIIIAARG